MSTPRPHRAAAHPQGARARGFTLVEVLVALVIMSVLATMAWRGVDAMARAREATQARSDTTLRLATVVAQWEQDLRALVDTGGTVPAITFDGATLRLVRQAPQGVRVVAWSLREGRWLRWAGPAVTRAAELQESWLRSQQLQGSEPDQLLLLDGIESWQLYFHRGNAWTNAQSTGDLAPATPAPVQPGAPPAQPQRERAPNAVRLALAFAGSSGLQGSLNRDVMLAPQQP